MANRILNARIDGVGEDGSFSMTLVTDGEASDGDILSIEGGRVPKRMPLLLSHFNDPTATAGSVTSPQKDLKATPKRLRATGQIEMGGEGALADVRRDVAFMVNQGHIGAVSVRWDEQPGGKPPVRRVNLPSDHPAFVDAEKEKSWRKRNGFFWPEWKALEGSIVALGADPEALIGRSLETEGAVSTFWRAMASDLEDPERDVAKVSAALAALRIDAQDCREAGATDADLLNAVLESANADDFEVVELGGRSFFLPAEIAERLESEELAQEPDQEPATLREPEPEPVTERQSPLVLDAADLNSPLDVQALVEIFGQKLDESEQRMKRNVQFLLDAQTGRVRQ